MVFRFYFLLDFVDTVFMSFCFFRSFLVYKGKPFARLARNILRWLFFRLLLPGVVNGKKKWRKSRISNWEHIAAPYYNTVSRSRVATTIIFSARSHWTGISLRNGVGLVPEANNIVFRGNRRAFSGRGWVKGMWGGFPFTFRRTVMELRPETLLMSCLFSGSACARV